MNLVDFLLLSILPAAFGAKILLYNPLFGQSHVNFMRTLSNILVDDGHEVTVLAPRSSLAIRFDGSRAKKLIMFDMPQAVLDGATAQLENPAIWRKEGDSVFSYFTEDREPVMRLFQITCAATLNHTGLIDQLLLEKFDLGITEYFDACGLGIFHQIGLQNVILASSSLLFEPLSDAIGAPLPTSYVPGTASTLTPNELAQSLLLRVKNAIVTESSRNLFLAIIKGAQKALDARFPGNSSLLPKLAAQSSLVFTNNDPLLDFPRPTLHKVVNLAGIAVPKPKPVEQKWHDILNLRKKTVLISFGSVAKSYLMPAEMKASIVEVIKRLPDVTFIWKYEKEDEVGEGLKNLIKTKWMPQNDLLNSGKLSLFVTHGGMGSVSEMAASGVPFIAIGLFGDQLRNAKMLASHGSGIAYEKQQLANADRLEGAVRHVLEDSSFADNAKRVAKLIAARPFSPREEFSRYVRFVAEHGPLPQLSPASTQLSFVQLYFIDALLWGVALLSALVAAVILVTKSLLARISKATLKKLN